METMKKEWGKPLTQVQKFVPQYCQTPMCGDVERKYLFDCTAPAGRMYYYNNSPATGSRPSPGSPSTYVGNYTPCNKHHEAPTQGDFTYGFIDRNRNGREDNGEAAILYLEHGQHWNFWHQEYEDYISNGHATGELDMDEWEITKS